MKKLIFIVGLAASLTGCGTLDKTTLQPGEVSGGYTNQTSHPQTMYTVPANLNAISNALAAYVPLAQTILGVTPAAPAAPLLPGLLAGFFALTTAGLGVLARIKNNQANSHAAAAAALAATVIAPTPSAALALTNASANNSTAAVAVHLANAANPVQL